MLAPLLLGAASVAATPFPTHDQNPLLAGFGLPQPLPARLSDGWSVDVALNWANTALIQQSAREMPRETLIVDAETREGRVTIGTALSPRLTLQLQIPYRYTGGGTLDHFIDSWHDFFGLPKGTRPSLPRDRLHIAYARDGVALFDLDSSASRLGDVSLDVGYALVQSPSSAAALWLSVKLPTGNADLNKSGATDVSFVLAGGHRFHPRWSGFVQAGVTWLGDSDLLPRQQRDLVWSALAGIGWQAWRGLELKVQLDAHSAAFKSTELDFLGDSLALTVGGDYRFESGWQLDVGVSEDIAVETAPDVTFVFGVRRSF